MRIDIRDNERAILLVNGVAERWLGPGRNRVIAWLNKLEVVRFNVDHLVAEMRPTYEALAPSDELLVVDVTEGQRAIVRKAGVPQRWLGVGRWYVWTVDPKVRVELLDTTAVMAKPLAANLARIVNGADYTEVMVPTGHVALRYVDGELTEILRPGRHAAWTTERKVTHVVVDMREQVLQVAGQDVMTRDRVTLRLNVAVTWAVADAVRQATVARDPGGVMYTAVQLAVREAVTVRTLDELLVEREAVAAALRVDVVARAETLGVQVRELGIKDVILPGDMKLLLNRVIEARKQAEANVILRREEAAATRALAQTAKLLEEAPVLQRLKELEAMKELAAEVGEVNVIVGTDGLDAVKLLRK